MKVLLTGASGLLGHNVLCRLAAEGHRVVAPLRHRAALRMELPDGTEAVASDYSLASLTALAWGCEAVVNCAGTTAMHLRHESDYEAANVELPHRLVQAMEAAGVRRMVHVSTVNTIGYGTASHAADETAPMQEPFASSLYARSKRRGEQVVLEAAARHRDWHVVVVCPGFMLGPWDAKPSSGRMLLAAYKRPLMAAPRGGKAFVDVRDVAGAVVAALTGGEHGARYAAVSSSGQMSIKALYELQAATMGYRQRVVVLPTALLRASGAVGDALRWLGTATELCSNNMRQLTVHEHYDNRRAVEDLGMAETPLEVSIRDFHRWRQQENKKRK